MLKSPLNAGAVREAQAHEARVRLHSETALTQAQVSGAVTEFLEWVRGLIPQDKHKLFVHLFRYPVKTVEATQSAYEALEKVFDGRNPAISYDFVSEQGAQDWAAYRKEKLGWPAFWRKEAFSWMKTGINALAVVDLPAQQSGPLPEPYLYFLSVSKVLDFEMKGDALEWVIFKQPEGRAAVFDDASYRVYDTQGGMDFSRWVLASEAAHGLGYCPARWFWSDPVSYSAPAVKESPITAQLDNLDWMLFYLVSKRMLDSYASWPIYWSYIQDCDYRSGDGNEYCDGGFLRRGDNLYALDYRGHVAECPACSKRRLTGPGSLIGIEAPSPANGGSDLRPPAGVIPADTGNLEYVTREAQRLRSEFMAAVTGYEGKPVNSQAINREQVAAYYEGYTQTLRNLKGNFEKAQEWAAETICRLRYGPAFVSASVDYGTEFYIYTASQELAEYQAAQKEGAGQDILDALLLQYYETKYRNNPGQARRAKILAHLDPLRHLSTEQAAEMYRAGEVNYEDYALKARFSSLIMRFERENISVLQFGEALQFDEKIRRIQQTLIEYVNQDKPEGGQPRNGSTATEGNSGEMGAR